MSGSFSFGDSWDLPNSYYSGPIGGADTFTQGDPMAAINAGIDSTANQGGGGMFGNIGSNLVAGLPNIGKTLQSGIGGGGTTQLPQGQRPPLPAGAQMHTPSTGGLDTLLQLLQQRRAQMMNLGLPSGRGTSGGGLLGM
jgi:hypothetical protein